jgi:hypothetical protein
VVQHFLLFLILGFFLSAANAETHCTGAQRNDLAETPWSSVGMVISGAPGGLGVGTGFLISDRLILTAAHGVMEPTADGAYWIPRKQIDFLPGKAQITVTYDSLDSLVKEPGVIHAKIIDYGNANHERAVIHAGDDWVLLLLDQKPPISFQPLKLERLGPGEGETFITAGYPDSCYDGDLANFEIFEGNLIQLWPKFVYGEFPTLNIETSEGLSGGPVLRQTIDPNGQMLWRVVGILIGQPNWHPGSVYFTPTEEFLPAVVRAHLKYK